MSFDCFNYGLGFDVLCPEYCCSITTCRIGGGIDLEDIIRAEVWRTLNGVGNWLVIADNADGKYNALTGIDIQGEFHLEICDSTLMKGRIDGPGVTLSVFDAESDFREIVQIQGVDQAQDLLFHNDFEHTYSHTSPLIGALLDDIINTRIGYGGATGQTNIAYTDPGGTFTIGPIEFRSGGSFLGTIQDMHHAANYVFYVDDDLNLQSGIPGSWSSGVTTRCVEGDPSNNVIRFIEWNRRGGDKLYNYVMLYGKNPQFDAYTERNASDWTGINGVLSDDITTVRVDNYSLRISWTAGAQPRFELDFTGGKFNYTSLDFTKGEIGCWFYYETRPGVGPIEYAMISLYDGTNWITYYGDSMRVYDDEWNWINAPLGESHTGAAVPPPFTNNAWYPPVAGFRWDAVTTIRIYMYVAPAAAFAHELYIDGLTMPVPAIGVAQDITSQTTYRRRPLPLSTTNLRHQNAIQRQTEDLLAHHKDSNINHIALMCPLEPRLRYAGQGVIINIPNLSINNESYYLTSIHHVIEPRVDVSGGFGFDCVTEFTAAPVAGVDEHAYDSKRLSSEPIISSWNLAERGGTGLRLK